jgi:methyltransferase family protein
LLEAVAPATIVEVGAGMGMTTEKLLDFAVERDCTVHSIDPSPAPRFDPEKLGEEYGDRFVFHREKSLDALPRIRAADVVLLDGDHNWYTVYHELELLSDKASSEERAFPLTLLHDVDWPYGRRDLYYDPEAIPDNSRQPFEQSGVVFGEDALSPDGVNVIERHAVSEGNPRNGVRTGIEDFLQSRGDGLRFDSVAGFHGLGILVSEGQVERNEPLRRVLDDLDSPLLREQTAILEGSRLSLLRKVTEDKRTLARLRRIRLELKAQLRRGPGSPEPS